MDEYVGVYEADHELIRKRIGMRKAGDPLRVSSGHAGGGAHRHAAGSTARNEGGFDADHLGQLLARPLV